MTWNEFKKIVDDKLAEMGKDGSEEIYYIDTSLDMPVVVSIDSRDGLKIE